MLVTTTATLQDRKIGQYLGLVTGESILGANIFRDVFAGIRDIVGGRAGSYEKVLRDARNMAVEEMVEQARKLGANAVIGVDVDYETVGGTMLMVSVSGTAVQAD
ncbi:MAG TPA: YbjQ family protein [Steroidobacteraceae bacterium]|jgi:uncharacterized protein YbjQ (UPF0145 family)|nr:YbjQ family protein [Steroidobacteraceae bacterium]